VDFLKTFNGFEISMKLCVFLYHFNFFNQIFVAGHISTFSNFGVKLAKNVAKNQKTYFSNFEVKGAKNGAKNKKTY
jgi:hypothetical protein